MEQTIITEILAMGTNTLKVFYYLLDQYKTTGIISRPEMVYITDRVSGWIAQIRDDSERLNNLLDERGDVAPDDVGTFTETCRRMRAVCAQVEHFGDRLKGLCYARMHRPTPMQEIEQLFNAQTL